jgi:hypothetical protein
MAGEGPPSTTLPLAVRKVVDAGLRRHEAGGAVCASVFMALGIRFRQPVNLLPSRGISNTLIARSVPDSRTVCTRHLAQECVAPPETTGKMLLRNDGSARPQRGRRRQEEAP